MNDMNIERDFLDVTSDLDEAQACAALHGWHYSSLPVERRAFESAFPKWSQNCIAALNRIMVRLANGQDVSPGIRHLLSVTLETEEIQLVPKRPRRGRTGHHALDVLIVAFVASELRKSPGKRGQLAASFSAAAKTFGKTPKRIEQIWRLAEANTKSLLEQLHLAHELLDLERRCVNAHLIEPSDGRLARALDTFEDAIQYAARRVCSALEQPSHGRFPSAGLKIPEKIGDVALASSQDPIRNLLGAIPLPLNIIIRPADLQKYQRVLEPFLRGR